MKKIINFLSASLLAATVIGCESEGKYTIYSYPEPTIGSITPSTGYTGSQMAILGHNFGNRTEPIEVYFGSLQATVLSCKNDMIIVQVPDDARSSDVSLKVWQYEYNSIGHFTIVDKPSVTSVLSDNTESGSFAREGDIITITGTSFGSSAEDATVTMGIVEARILSINDTEIKAITPAGYGYGEVAVNIRGYEAVGGRMIDPDHIGDITSYALENHSQPFTSTADAAVSSWYIPSAWQFNDGCYCNDNGEQVLKRPLLIESNGNYKAGALGFLCNQWSDFYHKQGYSNAKMFQTAYLPAGEYETTVYVSECVLLSGTLEAIAGVSRGKGTLPDMTGKDGIAGWTVVDETPFFDNGNGGKSYLSLTDDKNINYDAERGPVTMSFRTVVDSSCDATIGFVANVKMASGRQGGDILVTKIKFERIR